MSPEMLLEITKHVCMRNYYNVKLYHVLKLPRMLKIISTNQYLVNILDGQTCIILESQHIRVSCLVFVFSYLYLGYLCSIWLLLHLAMQPPRSMLVVSHMFLQNVASRKSK